MSELAKMFDRRADSNRKYGNRYWARDRSNEGDFYYGKARDLCGEEKTNRAKTEKMRK